VKVISSWGSAGDAVFEGMNKGYCGGCGPTVEAGVAVVRGKSPFPSVVPEDSEIELVTRHETIVLVIPFRRVPEVESSAGGPQLNFAEVLSCQNDFASSGPRRGLPDR
jgi:hypothetical protein